MTHLIAVSVKTVGDLAGWEVFQKSEGELFKTVEHLIELMSESVKLPAFTVMLDGSIEKKRHLSI